MAPSMNSSLCSALVLALISSLAAPSCANTFLARDPASLEDGSGDLLLELGRVAGDGRGKVVPGRVSLLEESLRPSFRALPRGAGDRIPADAVRYLLHRLFVDRHGWFVRGLDAQGQAWNSSSPADIFKSHSGEVHGLFKQRLVGDGGFTLHEVAVLAATLESFVHEETVERLRSAYRLAGLSGSQDNLSEQQVYEVMDVYMMMFVMGMNHSTTTNSELQGFEEVVEEAYPNWELTKAWVREVRNEVLSREFRAESPTSFGTTMRVLEEIAERYGRWQDRECKHIKSDLQALEHKGTGRVRLETFYSSALNGSWQFSESKAYLRELGALDENDPLRPSVIIPNYVNSPSNCVASSMFYSVCCIDECEVLLANLEQQIAAPSASPARVAELVAKMPSATVPAPRVLPDELVGRLEEIAQTHDGKVPFHGRLFAQFLHHAYPRECPFPRLSGSSAPASPEEWQEQTGQEPAVDEDTMRFHIEEAMRAGQDEAATGGVNASMSAGAAIPWHVEEELFLSHPEVPTVAVGFYRVGVLAMMAAAASMGLSLGKSSSGALGAVLSTAAGGAPPKELKHLV